MTPVDAVAFAALQAARFEEQAGSVILHLPQMVPDVYAKLKPILTLCGFAWKSKRAVHVGTADAATALGVIIESGEYDDTKRGLEFFATSPAAARVLADVLARELSWMPEPRILEPSAGDGAMVQAVLDAMPRAQVTAVELDPRRAAQLRKRFEGNSQVVVIEADILTVTEGNWDGVLMNPPFAEALEHLQHLYGMLEPGTHIVGIACLTRPRDRELALWLNDRDAWTEETERETFVDTTIKASYFGFRVGRSLVDTLLDVLQPHPVALTNYRALMELSRDAHQLFTDRCDDKRNEAFFDQRFQTIANSVRDNLGSDEIGVEYAWDPRAGYGFLLALPSGRKNDFGDTGIIVPTALPPLR